MDIKNDVEIVASEFYFRPTKGGATEIALHKLIKDTIEHDHVIDTVTIHIPKTGVSLSIPVIKDAGEVYVDCRYNTTCKIIHANDNVVNISADIAMLKILSQTLGIPYKTAEQTVL